MDESSAMIAMGDDSGLRSDKGRMLKPNRSALVILLIVLGFVGVGIYLDRFHAGAYDRYVEEDGIVEWLTVLGLLAIAVTSFSRFLKLRKLRSLLFLGMLLLFSLVLLFGVGEEISWGQRLLNIESSQFFLENNAQQETNIHNLIIGEKKINKIIFGKILAVVILSHLFLLPWLYRKSETIRRWIDRLAIPVPGLYAGIFLVAVVLLLELTGTRREGELIELTGSFVYLTIFLYPVNQKIFDKG